MPDNLSPREREIFDLLLEGFSPKVIAKKLHISHATVDFHRTNLYGKPGDSIQEGFEFFRLSNSSAILLSLGINLQ